MTTEVSIVTLFADQTIANQAIDAFRKEGFASREIRILEDKGAALATELAQRGFAEDDVRGFAEAVGRGMILVAARVLEDEVDQATDVLDFYEGKKARGVSETRTGGTVEIVEESLSVNKPKVSTGGVRVTSKVIERPVEETVTLREEHVATERRPVDRTLGADEANAAFEEKTVEVMGTREEVEVRKEARVTGEVVVNKDVNERVETVRDTVRSTDVKVEEVAGARNRK